MFDDLDELNSLQCCSIVGSGDLSSQIWRMEKCDDSVDYAFTLVKSTMGADVAWQVFTSSDLLPLVRLVRVLAQEIRHDGGGNDHFKTFLQRLISTLGVLLDDPDYSASREPYAEP